MIEKSAFTRFLQATAQLLAPDQCIVCQEIDHGNWSTFLCPNCEQSIQGRIVHQHGAVALGELKGALARLLHTYKYDKQRELAKVFARLILNNNMLLKQIEAADVITVVPSSYRRLALRGFHPAWVVAKQLGKATGRPCCIDLLKKTRHTPHQTGQPRARRLINLDNSIQLQRRQYTAKNILLFDDVVTTGATLNICRQQFAKLPGPPHVSCLTIAATTTKL